MTWKSTRLKYLAQVPITNGLGEAGAFDDPSWPRYVRTTDIAGPRTLREDVFASLPQEIAARAPLISGDLVLTAAGTIGKSLLYLDSARACYAGYLVRFRPRSDVDPRFISYWTESTPYWDQIRAGTVVSTIENFSAGKYRNMVIAVPDTAGQKVIADFLDAETARIDALIAKKRRMIELLIERLVTVVKIHSQRVTRRTMLRRLAESVRTGGTPTDASLYGPAGSFEFFVEWLSPGDFDGTLDIQRAARDLSKEWAVPAFRAGSILIVGIGATAGKVGFLQRPAWGNQQVTAIEIEDSQLARHVAWELWSSREALLARAPFTTLPILNNDFLKSLDVAHPVPEACRETVALLDAEAGKQEQLTQCLSEQIELLSEHRQALITAAVTGQLPIPA